MQEDLDKLNNLVNKKKSAKQCNEQEIIQSRKYVKNVEKDVEELNDCKNRLKEEIQNERELQGSI